MSYSNMHVFLFFNSWRPSSLVVDSGSLMTSPSHILHLAWVLHILTLPAYWDLRKDLVDRVSEAIPAVARCVHWFTWFIGCAMWSVELPGPVKPKTSQSLVCPLSILHLFYVKECFACNSSRPDIVYCISYITTDVNSKKNCGHFIVNPL